jgi:hypothetical protein
MNFTRHLTTDSPEFDAMVKATPPGAAHWSGTGPDGTTCEGCRHYGYSEPIRNSHGDTIKTVKHDKSCQRFFELMRWHGGKIEPSTPSCRHYEPKPHERKS